jgi:hypothetical protein
MSYPGAINAIVFLVVFWAMYRLVSSEENDLDWTQLISTKGKDGLLYFDWNRVGQGCGVVVSMAMPFIYVHTDKMDGSGLAMVMTASLAYLGGVTSYVTTLRAKQKSTGGKDA